MEFSAAIVELAKLWNIEVESNAEAIEMTDDLGSPWILEYPNVSQLFTLYTPLHILVNEDRIEFWLMMNSQRELLGCSWISLHEGRLHLGLSLPKDKFDVNELHNIVQQMYLIKEKVQDLGLKEKEAHMDSRYITTSFI